MGGLIGEESIVASVGAIGIDAENTKDSEELVEGRGRRRRWWQNEPSATIEEKPTPYMAKFILSDETNVPLINMTNKSS